MKVTYLNKYLISHNVFTESLTRFKFQNLKGEIEVWELNNVQYVSVTSASPSFSGIWVQNCLGTAPGVIKQQRKKKLKPENTSKRTRNPSTIITLKRVHNLAENSVIANYYIALD